MAIAVTRYIDPGTYISEVILPGAVNVTSERTLELLPKLLVLVELLMNRLLEVRYMMKPCQLRFLLLILLRLQMFRIVIEILVRCI